MWEQTVAPDWRIPYVGGWCEGHVEGMWGQATLPMQDKNGNWYTMGQYSSAAAKWASGVGNHPGELPPSGIIVPVYFDLGNDPNEHTAVSLGDGRYVSSTLSGYHDHGYVHPSLQHLIDMYAGPNGGCAYLGWSTYVGKIEVVKNKEKGMNLEQARNEAQRIGLLAHMTEAEITPDWVEYHAKNMVADPAYAAALSKQLYEGTKWQNDVWKSTHYDEEVEKAYQRGLAANGSSNVAPGTYVKVDPSSIVEVKEKK